MMSCSYQDIDTECRDITYSNAMTAADHKSDFKHTKDTPYLALMGELWGVCYEDLYSTTLYLDPFKKKQKKTLCCE